MNERFLRLGDLEATTEAAVLGAAMATPYAERAPYATESPAAIRTASARLARFIGNYDFDTGAAFGVWRRRVADAGDINVNRADPEGNRRRITSAIAKLIAADVMPVLLGGDDSVAEPFVDGWRDHGPVTVVQLDAHLDFRDEVAGEKHGYSSPMRRIDEMEHVRRIIHVGQRGVGSARPHDVQDTLSVGNVIVTARELTRVGPASVAELLPVDERFVLIYDVDVTDPSEIPSVRAPVPGGPGLTEIEDVVDALAGRGTLEGLVVTEFDSDRDATGRCAISLARLVCRVLDAKLG